MTDRPTRRKFDQTPDDIEQMILETENPKDRATLLIMLNIADRLVQHEEDEMAMMINAKRLVLVVLFFTNAILGMVVWYGSRVLTQFEAYMEKTDGLVIEIERHKEHHRQEERFNGGPKVN